MQLVAELNHRSPLFSQDGAMLLEIRP